MNLPALNLPTYNLKIQFSMDNEQQIFDIFRKKWVILNPEEWVRQNFLHYMVSEKNYPRSLVKVEQQIDAFNKLKRCDAIFYNNALEEIAILECKAPQVKISRNTFDQIGLYNSALKVPFLFITNGLEHFSCKFDFKLKKMEFLESIPDYHLAKKY